MCVVWEWGELIEKDIKKNGGQNTNPLRHYVTATGSVSSVPVLYCVYCPSPPGRWDSCTSVRSVSGTQSGKTGRLGGGKGRP